jgi:hypothetical protein
MADKEAIMIELTEQQAQAMEEEKAPMHVMNPRTQEVFVLIRQDVFTSLRAALWAEGPAKCGAMTMTTTSF